MPLICLMTLAISSSSSSSSYSSANLAYSAGWYNLHEFSNDPTNSPLKPPQLHTFQNGNLGSDTWKSIAAPATKIRFNITNGAWSSGGTYDLQLTVSGEYPIYMIFNSANATERYEVSLDDPAYSLSKFNSISYGWYHMVSTFTLNRIQIYVSEDFLFDGQLTANPTY